MIIHSHILQDCYLPISYFHLWVENRVIVVLEFRLQAGDTSLAITHITKV